MLSKVNRDILFLLFEKLQNDSRSLFSCLLVNRSWCKIAIPILWRNPWCYEDNINYQKKGSLYHIITFSLPKDVKEFLTSQGIQLFPTSHQPPLFDYLSFCRSINIKVIKDIISFGFPSTYNKFLLQQEIYRFFMRKFPEIVYLDMRSIEHQIFYFRELKCDMSINSVFFFGLACICKKVQRIIFINTSMKDNDGMIKLIEVQKNLRYFEWKNDFYSDNSDGFNDLQKLYF